MRRFGGSGFQFRILTKAQRAALKAEPQQRDKTIEDQRADRRAQAARKRKLATLGAMVEAAIKGGER